MTVKQIIVIFLGLLILSIGSLTAFVLLKEDVENVALGTINKNISTEMSLEMLALVSSLHSQTLAEH